MIVEVPMKIINQNVLTCKRVKCVQDIGEVYKCILLVGFIISLIQTRVTWEEGSSVEELHLSDWLVSVSGHFLGF